VEWNPSAERRRAKALAQEKAIRDFVEEASVRRFFDDEDDDGLGGVRVPVRPLGPAPEQGASRDTPLG